MRTHGEFKLTGYCQECTGSVWRSQKRNCFTNCILIGFGPVMIVIGVLKH